MQLESLDTYPLTALADDLAQHPQLAKLHLGGDAIGLLAAAKPAVAAMLAGRLSAPLVWVVPHPQTAVALADDLRSWWRGRVDEFPAVETLPYERAPVDRSVVARRQAVARACLNSQADIIVAPVRALLQPVARPTAAAADLRVATGDHMPMDRLLSELSRSGYAAVDTIEEPGTFAHRGGVVDVFSPLGDDPVRLEFFGNDIESLRIVDVESQRSRERIETAVFPPVIEMRESVRTRALAELNSVDVSDMSAQSLSLWLEDLSRLESGASFEDLPVFAPYLIEDPASLLHYLSPGALVVVDDPVACRNMMTELCVQAGEIQTEMERSGQIPHGLVHPLLSEDALGADVQTHTELRLHWGSEQVAGAAELTHVFAPAPLFAGRVRDLLRALSDDREGRVVLASRQTERLSQLLTEEGIPHAVGGDVSAGAGLALVSAPIQLGWQVPDRQLTVLSDHEMFGQAARHARPPRRRTARDAFATEYAVGDYVVHLEHGVGRFEGIARMDVAGAEREYAVVGYAGSDRVYVPSDQLERITRYVGVGDTPPTLNRLGGGEWQRARQRAKKAAEDIAADLLSTYSKRMARPGHAFGPDTPWQRELESSFPYMETVDQLRAVREVKMDMEQPRPMDRLVCADVGYGKTEVAVRAAFKAVMDGKQVALLAPTTILAQQHFETFSERFGAFPIRVEALSRFRSPAEQRQILERAESGDVDVVVGTHRLLSADVAFKNLGLLIIDEEQRFGVKHKEQLKRMRETIDVLTLTATPIPRTLHMGLVGIREISVIETAPEGRLPIQTYLQPFEERLLRDAIVRELDRDGQTYVVHNKVSTIQAFAEQIRRLVPDARVLVGHGQMEESQLEKVMLSFGRYEADVLVASTIIENGLDIPNVNTIIVNHAEALGLTQLYQLRGRVGRGSNQAYAYLLYPRDARLSVDAMRRMEAVFEAQELGSGFNIAMKDLEIRGAGNLLGAEQSGHASAVGFDLFTRMIGEEVERQRGASVEEAPSVTVDLPLTMFLPAGYIGSESERLVLYRRLASLSTQADLEAMRDELQDRFGGLPVEVDNLLTSVRIKVLAGEAHVVMLSLSNDALTFRVDAQGVYDRVSLYRRYGGEARVSTNVLRIPRRQLDEDWVRSIEDILTDMIVLRERMRQPQSANA